MAAQSPELEDTAQADDTDDRAAKAEDRTVTATPGRGAAHAATVPAPPANSPAGTLAAGLQLGHFKIERLLGAGGMGEVYLATDLALDCPAAVKVLPESAARDDKRRERLVREARAQARVAHPNVGHMYFVGEHEHRLYFAMEYVAGKTLAEAVAEGPMPVDDALEVIRAVALGLREAQRSGITHRDIKPSNLMLDGHGGIKVLDFGLAAGNFETAGDDGPVAQTSLAGTPLYMAPEQARGDAVDFRTDIYALGATLFHLVSGKPPFEADSVEALVSMHATAARPALPRRGRRRVQIGALDALCSRMMASDPADRFASYDELIRAIEMTSDAHTKPAGFWARGLAMTLDFLLVSLTVSLTSIVVSQFGVPEIETTPVSVVILAVLQALTTARTGTTPGKSVMELEVVDVETLQRPRLSRTIRRSLVLYGLPILALWLDVILQDRTSERDLFSLIFLGWVVLGLLALIYASLRATGKRTLWDRASRTMVRYRTTRRSVGSD